MKNFKLTVIALLVSVSTAFAQQDYDPDMSDKWVLSDLTKTVVNTDDNETYIIKQLEITEEFTPVKLDPEDKHKLNQDIIYMPTQVTKKIKLDFDKDTSYDKEVEFSYTKPEGYELDFTLTKKGIIILTDKYNLFVSKMWNKKTKVAYSNVKSNRIKQEGVYTIKLSKDEEIDITISNYDIY